MKDTYLIQRLEKPWESRVFPGDNPFSFGGGLKNGGLNPQIMDLLRPIFQFDYMGAAEYEFGILPQTLKKLASLPIKAGKVELKDSEVSLVNSYDKGKAKPLPLVTSTVYYLGPEEFNIEERIREIAKDKYDIKQGYKVLSSALRGDSDTVGWLELDNGFFFFTDEEMFNKTKALFGVK